MARPGKDELIKARVTKKMKRALEKVSRKRGESEAVIIREAIIRYIETNEGRRR